MQDRDLWGMVKERSLMQDRDFCGVGLMRDKDLRRESRSYAG